MGIRYVISCYDKDTDILLGEVGAEAIPLTDLQQLFELSIQGVLTYESHVIDPEQAQSLTMWMQIPFDFTQYIYQLDCFPNSEIPSLIPVKRGNCG